MPNAPIEDGGRQDVRVETRERAICPVKTADVVPSPREGEPQSEGRRLEHDVTLIDHGLGEIQGLRQRDDDVLLLFDDALMVNAQAVRRAPVVNRDAPVTFHSRARRKHP